MTDKYRLYIKPEDPSLTIQLPDEVINDLTKKAQEFGRSLNIEILLRLVRSLDLSDSVLAEHALLSEIFTHDPEEDDVEEE